MRMGYDFQSAASLAAVAVGRFRESHAADVARREAPLDSPVHALDDNPEAREREEDESAYRTELARCLADRMAKATAERLARSAVTLDRRMRSHRGPPTLRSIRPTRAALE
jgi:hypothetical protein